MTGTSLVSFAEKNYEPGRLILYDPCFFIGRFNMFLDDLPIWGELAFVKQDDDGGGNETVYVYTHKKLTIHYNGPYIIEVILTVEDAEKLEVNKEIEFTYEVCVME